MLLWLINLSIYLSNLCGEDIEVLESFTYLSSVVHNSGRSDQEVIRRTGLCLRCYGLSQHEYMKLSAPMQENKAPHLLDACAPCLTVWL